MGQFMYIVYKQVNRFTVSHILKIDNKCYLQIRNVIYGEYIIIVIELKGHAHPF